MNTALIMKIVGVACTVGSFGIGIVQDKLSDKKLDEKIAKEVAKHLESK